MALDVSDKMKGRPNLKPGTKVKSNHHDIKHNHLALDGTEPHAMRFTILSKRSPFGE